jgi:hypothetical protein
MRLYCTKDLCPMTVALHRRRWTKRVLLGREKKRIEREYI